MYRLVEVTGGEEKIYGVLTDYDISLWTGSPNPNHTKTAQKYWIGTPLYMAQELLKGTSPVHLYRHDVESLFYVMLMTSARHSFGTSKRQEQRGWTRPPYENWLNERSYHTLGAIKNSFLWDGLAIELSPDFEDFRPWLDDLQDSFSMGFKRRPTKWSPKPWRPAKPAPAPFDEETLGGYVEYGTILEAIPHLRGELEGLIVRYPKSSSAPASSTLPGAA